MATGQWAREYYKDYDNLSGRCPTCGLLFARDVPEDIKLHRSFHRQVVSLYEPLPNKRLAQRVARNGPFIQLTALSPGGLRRRLYDMGRQWKRELGYDFPPYDMDGDDGRSYLIVDEDGRLIGGFSVRWREFRDAPHRWRFTWIWIVPTFRRKGHLRRTWNFIQARFDRVEPEPPFSLGAASFFSARTDISNEIRAIAQRMAFQVG